MARGEPFGGAGKESQPRPIDVHVGAHPPPAHSAGHVPGTPWALGLTFQQVQKYERGVNRVGGARLFDLSRILDVPIGFFFDDVPDVVLSQRETLELVGAYYRILDPAVRQRVLNLIKSLGSVET